RHDSRRKCPCPLGREICESPQTAIPQGQFPGARRLLPALIPSMTAPSPRWLHQHIAVRPQLHRRFPHAQVPASEPANQRSSMPGLRRPLSPNQAERHRAPKSDGMILCVPPRLSAHFPPPHAPSRSRISAVDTEDTDSCLIYTVAPQTLVRSASYTAVTTWLHNRLIVRKHGPERSGCLPWLVSCSTPRKMPPWSSTEFTSDRAPRPPG
ncbi:hypothetical protein CKAH01_14258, partial [Colletotrichum kahawae]